MSVSTVITWLIFACLAAGAIDFVLGGRLGLGPKFEDGFKAIGSLALSMVGIMALVPLISSAVAPVVAPLFRAIGADPALFAGILLPIDMGGYAMSVDLADDPQIGLLSGCVLSTMMGCTVVFSIPVGLGIVRPDDRRPFSLGMLYGFVTIPLGVFAAGLVMGIEPLCLLRNLAPIAAVSVVLMLGIAKAPDAMVKGFGAFGRLVSAVSVVGIVLGAAHLVCGLDLVPGMDSLDEGLLTVGHIGVTLAGAFVLVEALSRVAKKPLAALGEKIGIGSEATLGVLACLAHIIPMFQSMRTFSDRGKVAACAFSVSGSFSLASHLAFVAGVEPHMMGVMLVGKLLAGVAALLLALVMTRGDCAPTGNAHNSRP